MALPTQKTPPIKDPARFKILIYGPPKIGKSTWCSQAPNALFLATEAGLGSLDVYQIPIAKWENLLAAVDEIASGKHQYKTIVIDTIDVAYYLAQEWLCRTYKVVHEQDLAYGKGTGVLRSQFLQLLSRLSQLPYGLILVSHSQERERDGKTRIIPTIPDKVANFISDWSDTILYADLEAYAGPKGERLYRRVIRTAPSHEYEAGDRTGRLPDTLPLDYEAFLAAYNGTGKAGGK